MLPRYFNDLHVAVSAITGVPRIVSCKEDSLSTDKYKDISEDEWESVLLNFFDFFKDRIYFKMLKSGGFVIGGNKAPKELAKDLKRIAKELEKYEG